MKISLFILFLVFSFSSLSQDSQYQEVGIADEEFKIQFQEKSNWCWAAAVQSILQYYHVYKNQKEIVKYTFGSYYDGELPNFGGSIQNIANNLNNWGITHLHGSYQVSSIFYDHPPTPEDLVYFLSKKQPIYLSYQSGPTMNHAVILTNCKYKNTSHGPEIEMLTVHDPWYAEENQRKKGIERYYYDDFVKEMRYFWVIYVTFDKDNNKSEELIRNQNSQFCKNMINILDGFDNQFINIRGKKLDGTDNMYYSSEKFPESISRNGDLIYLGENPRYSISFYRGDNADSATLVFNNLKKKFEFLGELKEIVRTPILDTIPSFKNITINICLEDQDISLEYRTSNEGKKTRYSTNITLKTKNQLF